MSGLGVIEKHAGGFSGGQKAIYRGILPIGPEVDIMAWNPAKWECESRKKGHELVFSIADRRYRSGLVPVQTCGIEHLDIWWVAPHQLKRVDRDE